MRNHAIQILNSLKRLTPDDYMNRYIILSSLLLCFLLLPLNKGHGQSTEITTATTAADSLRRLSGTLTDGTTRQPIPGAAIVLLASDSTGVWRKTATHALSNHAGTFVLDVPVGTRLALRITSLGYQSTQVIVLENDHDLRITLYPEIPAEEGIPVAIVGKRRSRSVEDGCCRVESIREEVQQHAPFSPSPVESLRRYSSCTSGRVVNVIDDAGTISLRGLEPTRVGLLLDGAPLFSGISRFYGLGLIPSHALQTIQIAEGASDARYGNGAISGIVNLQTRPPTEEGELTGSLNLAGESITPDQIDLNLGYTGMAGGLGIAAFGSYNRHSISLPDLQGELNRDYERGSGLVKGNILLDNLTEMTVTILGGTEHRQGIVETDGEEDYSQELRLNRVDGVLTLSRLIGENGELIGTGAISRVGVTGNFGPAPLEVTQTIGYGEARFTGMAGDHTFALGAGGRTDIFSEEESAAQRSLDYDVSTLSLYAQDAFAFAEDWTLLGSARLDNHSSAGVLVAPRASLRYAPSESITMRLMGGEGFKGESTFDEDYRMLTGTYRRRGNPDLKFERSWTLNYDVSWDLLLGEHAGLNTNLNAYYTRINGRHTPQPDSLARGIFFAINDANPSRLIGMELQGRGTIGTEWSWSAAVAFIDYSTTDPEGERVPVPLAPRLNVDGSVTYRNENAGVTAEAWGSRIGAQTLPASINGITETEPYLLLNGRVEKAFGPIALFAGILNALDKRQAELMPLVQRTGEIPDGGIAWGMAEGREFFAGIRVRM